MSIALLVRSNYPLALVEIETGASAALRDLLNLDRATVVRASFDDSDRSSNSTILRLAGGSRRVLCSLVGHDEQVAATPLTVPVQLPTNDGSFSFADQVYVSVEWHFKKTPLCWALVAAVAAGLARCQGAEIEDSAGFFTTANNQTPDVFCRTLKLDSPNTDPNLAAIQLYAKMPKSAEVTEWLERQPIS